jgi:mRNA interferase MazF
MRGQIYRVDIGYGPKSWLIVSNNLRNRALDTTLAVRITTTDKSHVITAVPLGHNDPVAGFVLADDLEQLDEHDIKTAEYMGAISPELVPKVNEALRLALGLA